jgi:NAD(P)-dependent dehydrogenase (short-subunit alcohol dehydrogenase family)
VQDLGGKVAVVTGGAGGIGRALGERFLAEGMKVVLSDIDEPILEGTVDELSGRYGDAVAGVPTDVSQLESVERLRDATLDTFGAVHLVCNNAGIPSGSDGALWEHHVNDWRWAIDVNVFGVIHGINVFVPLLLAQGEGHVVNTSSSNGTFAPLSNSTVYATTKAAVTTISECLWGQLRAMDAPVQASVLLPSTRTPGALNTGIWRPGRNRPERYARPGQAPVEGRDALTPFVEQLHRYGQELVFAPLEEVAEIALEGILADQFWIYLPSDRSRATIDARAASMRDACPPEYLIEPSPWNVPKK